MSARSCSRARRASRRGGAGAPAPTAPSRTAPPDATAATATSGTASVVVERPDGVTLTLRGNGSSPCRRSRKAKDAPRASCGTFRACARASVPLDDTSRRARRFASASGPQRHAATPRGRRDSKPYAYRVQPDAVNPAQLGRQHWGPGGAGSTPPTSRWAKAAPPGRHTAPTAPRGTSRPPHRGDPRPRERQGERPGACRRRFTAPDQLTSRASTSARFATFARITGLTWSIVPRCKGVVDVSLHDGAVGFPRSTYPARPISSTKRSRARSSASPRSRRCARKANRAASWPRSRRSPVSW